MTRGKLLYKVFLYDLSLYIRRQRQPLKRQLILKRFGMICKAKRPTEKYRRLKRKQRKSRLHKIRSKSQKPAMNTKKVKLKKFFELFGKIHSYAQPDLTSYQSVELFIRFYREVAHQAVERRRKGNLKFCVKILSFCRRLRFYRTEDLDLETYHRKGVTFIQIGFLLGLRSW